MRNTVFAVVLTVFVVVFLAWVGLGILGVAEGSTDELTQSFRMAVSFVTGGGRP